MPQTKIKKLLQNIFVAAIFGGLFFGTQPLISAQNSRLTEISAQVVKIDSGEIVDNLTAGDFRLYENGRAQKIVSVERETRPLSIVIAFVTNPGSCPDGLTNNASRLAAAFQKILTANEDLAIVMTDKNGSIVRGFGRAAASLGEDFAKAENIAGKNSFPPVFNDNNPNVNSNGGVYEIYPLPALQMAVKLLRENAPRASRRVILFVNALENTNVGKADAGRALLHDLISEQTTLAWLGSGDDEKSFDLAGAPFGKRKFYLGMTDFSGGESQPCKAQKPVIDLFSKPRPTPSVQAEDELAELLDRLRTRYHISYRSNDAVGDELRGVRLELNGAGRNDKNTLIHYPKAVHAAR
ncbi:MAG TPA: hypothetical protein VGC76_01460 [Pyrinomonadaceae bacterium]|jgi:hypothetical protein